MSFDSITLEIQTVDAHPDFMDMTVDSLQYVLKFFETPIPGEVEDTNGSQWIRLYRNGDYEFFTPD